jgi:hypothetical protein
MKKEFIIFEIEMKDVVKISSFTNGAEYESMNTLSEWSRHDTLQEAEEQLERIYFERADKPADVRRKEVELIIMTVYTV